MTTLVISKKSLSALWVVVAAGLGLGVCLAVFHSLTLGLCLAAMLSASVMQLSTARALASELSNSRLVPELAESLANSLNAGLSLIECFEDLSRSNNTRLADKAQRMSAILDSNLGTSRKLSSCAQLISCREADVLFQLLEAAAVFGDRKLNQILIGFAKRTRELHALEDELKSRLGWIKGTATLARFAPWIVVLFLCFRPEAAAAFNTPMGAGVLISGLVASELARRMINAAAGARPAQRSFQIGGTAAVLETA